MKQTQNAPYLIFRELETNTLFLAETTKSLLKLIDRKCTMKIINKKIAIERYSYVGESIPLITNGKVKHTLDGKTPITLGTF